MKPEELADELGANAAELEGFFSSRPGTDTAPRFAETLRQAASALRRVEKLEEAFNYVCGLLPGGVGAIDREADTYVINCMVNIGELRRVRSLRQALGGEA